MQADAADPFRECAALVRRRDEDRWLSAHYAPRAQRRPLLALYALHLEIESAPARVSEAPLGEIRLQWWREAIAEIAAGEPARAHPAVRAARNAQVISPQACAAFEAAIDARARLLYGAALGGVAERAAWLRPAEAYLAVLAARLLAPIDRRAERAVEDAAVAFALARSRGHASSPAGRSAALQLHQNAAPIINAVTRAATPAVAHFALTPLYLARAGGAPSPLRKRIRLFRAVASGRIPS